MVALDLGKVVPVADVSVRTAAGADQLTWHAGKDRAKADAVRAEVLEALSGFAPGR